MVPACTRVEHCWLALLLVFTVIVNSSEYCGARALRATTPFISSTWGVFFTGDVTWIELSIVAGG